MATVNLNRFPSEHELFRLFLKRKQGFFFSQNKIISEWIFFPIRFKNFNLFSILKNMNISREIPYLPIDQYFFLFFFYLQNEQNNVMPNGEENVTNSILEMMHADRHTVGHYRCTADNRVGQPDGREIFVNVLCKCFIFFNRKKCLIRKKDFLGNSIKCQKKIDSFPCEYKIVREFW